MIVAENEHGLRVLLVIGYMRDLRDHIVTGQLLVFNQPLSKVFHMAGVFLFVSEEHVLKHDMIRVFVFAILLSTTGNYADLIISGVIVLSIELLVEC